MSNRISAKVFDVLQQDFLKLAVEDVNLAERLAGGAGLGAAGGLTSAAISSLPTVKRMVQLQGNLPELQARKDSLMQYLGSVRKQSPAELSKVTDRRLARALIEGGVPAEQHYVLRRGLEEGMSGTSRATKMLNLLRKRLKATAIKRTLLGAGIGAGGGLLSAVAQGHFDT